VKVVRTLAVPAAVVVVALAAIPASADPPPAGAGTTSHGFLAAPGAFSTIDHPDAATIPSTPDGQTGTGTLGINDRGQILGVYEGRDRVVRHFVRDRTGRYTILADPPGTSGDGLSYETVDINNRGEIVGFYNDDDGFTTTGFLRDRSGRFRDISFPSAQVTGPFRINDRRQVVGIYVDADGAVHGFLWDDGDFTTIDVPGATATVVLGINNRGQLVGSYVDADGAYHGFLRARHGDITTLPEAPDADPTMGGTQPASVNERGQIVGLAYDSRGGSRGFLFERGRFTLLDGADDATYTRALDINNRGQIVGDYGTRPPVRDSGSNARRLDRGRTPQPGVRAGRTRLP
jgi:probable HAF family extracellular repeat protein